MNCECVTALFDLFKINHAARQPFIIVLQHHRRRRHHALTAHQNSLITHGAISTGCPHHKYGFRGSLWINVLPLRLLRHFRLQNCLWRSLKSTLRRNQFTRSMHHVSQNLR